MDAYFNERDREFKGKFFSLTDDKNYPIIVFPANVSNKTSEAISLDSFLSYCRQERGNLPCLHILDEPTVPSKPQLMDIPKTHFEIVRMSFWKSSQWNAIKRHLKFALLISVIVGVFFFLFAEVSIIETVITAICFFICYYLFIVIPKLDMRETISKEIPYSKEEMEQLRNIENRRYQKEVEEYPKKIGDFTVYEDWYYHAINEREDIMRDCFKSFLSHRLKSYFVKSGDYEVVDEPPQKGRSEDLLFASLMSRMPKSVHIDTKVSGYYPDLMISTNNNVYIDVEIDEPYEMESKKEIHYIGCSDDERNERITQKEWLVIRFSESQVINKCTVCTNIIEKIKELIETGNIQLLDSINDLFESIKEKRWTKEEALMMAIEDVRNIKSYANSTQNSTHLSNHKNGVFRNQGKNKKNENDVRCDLPF